ncbi:MAG TPA: succinate dehydrogenase, cytochrome b556 subunit [Actinomycetota bacterium]|jgi:succinate dehydrogenase / fumarate reductase, cytochrome b subunit|nr:succinate dehydrogenase, cytochrome b556 subunit [Actinomycetota bacterium]
MLAARLIEGSVAVLTIGTGIFAMYLLVDLLRLKASQKGPAYKGGIGQWSWAAHRITGVAIIAFLAGHILDTFALGFGPELYDETISLYQQWWFKPFELGLIGAVLFHALNGVRIIIFDFWPAMALKQKQFAYVEFVLFVVGFTPAAVIMLKSAYETSPFA